jgi:hypothetical protein
MQVAKLVHQVAVSVPERGCTPLLAADAVHKAQPLPQLLQLGQQARLLANLREPDELDAI